MKQATASATIEAPHPLTSIPAELTARAQWVCWREVKKPGAPKPRKIPFNPRTNETASATDPKTWAGFGTAVNRAPAFDGIGFVFAKDDPYTGIDLDNCRDPETGALEPWAQGVVDRLNSYTEVSPSGTGAHIIARGTKPGTNNRRGGFEMYESDRYFTMTGQHLDGTPTTIEDRQAEIEAVYAEFLRDEDADDGNANASTTLTEAEIIEKAKAAKNGEKFTALWSGDWQSTGAPSQSEADLKLCCALAFWTGKDTERMDRLFRQSGLMRAKWDERHGAKTYGAITVATAIHQTKDVWQGGRLRELNVKHFVVREGGKTRVLNIEHDHVLGRRFFTRSSFDDFRNFYRNQAVVVGRKDDVPVTKDLGSWWLTHPERRQYDSVVFAPNRTVDGAFNLWEGFAVEPVQGDCAKFKRHLLHVICNGNREHYDYLIRYMARCVQRPDRQGEVAVVFRGGQGTGKGAVLRYFGPLFGQHFLQIANARHLSGNFNAHLRDCLVLFADEAFWAGDKAGKGVLKTLVTEPVLAFEAKGVDAVLGPNYVHLFMASNEEWVVPAEVDDRRFFVLDVSDSKRGDRPYFQALWYEMEHGGRAALLHELLHMGLSDFDVRDVPQTDALLHQKTLSLSPEDRWLFDKLQEGKWFRWQHDWSHRVEHGVPADLLHDDYARHAGVSGDRRRATATRLGMLLRKVFGEGMTKAVKHSYQVPTGQVDDEGHPRFVDQHGTVYRFPDLATCRRAFERHLGAVGRIAWDPEDDPEDDNPRF